MPLSFQSESLDSRRMLGRVFLGLTALLVGGYGVVCLLDPGVVTAAAGLALPVAAAEVEVRAMYGGVQVGVAVFTALGAVRADLCRPALFALALVFPAVAAARLLGMVLASSPDAYNLGAFAYEALSGALAVFLVRHRR